MKWRIYNLDLGLALNFQSAKIGPFLLSPVNNYRARNGMLYQPEKLNVTRNATLLLSENGLVSQISTDTVSESKSIKKPIRGKWVQTFDVDVHAANSLGTSFLARFPIQDGGLWDLCEILTFLTGRRTATFDTLSRFDCESITQPTCDPVDVMKLADEAWEHRPRIEELDLGYAVLCFNAASNFKFLQVRGSMQNTALNILLDQWPLEKVPKIAKPVKKKLIDQIESIVEASKELPEDIREAYKAVLRSKVNQGPFGPIDRLKALVEEFGMAENASSPEVYRRIQYINSARNTLTHTGQMPSLKGLSQEDSDRYTVAIAGSIVESINRIVLSQAFGINGLNSGLLEYDVNTLRSFFLDGIWEGKPLEIMDADPASHDC